MTKNNDNSEGEADDNHCCRRRRPNRRQRSRRRRRRGASGGECDGGGRGGGEGVLRLYRSYAVGAVLAACAATASFVLAAQAAFTAPISPPPPPFLPLPSSSTATAASSRGAFAVYPTTKGLGWTTTRAATAAAPSRSSSSLFGRRGTTTTTASATALRMAPSDASGGDGEWNAVVDALRMYKAAYGDLKVPSRFVVPGMPPWPEPAWGLKLGQRVSAIRSTGKYGVSSDEDRRRTLDDMGFLWRLRSPSHDKKMDGVTFDQIYDALETYRNVVVQKPAAPEGSSASASKISVPGDFVVPNSDPWPESTRGMPLGKMIPTVRSKAYLKSNPGAADRLTKLGFEFDGKVAANDQRYRRVYDALVRYKALNGDLLVPQPFVVPEGSDEWPAEMHGLRLGARVNAIRSQGTFVKTNPSRREELDGLGFVWDLPTGAGGKKRGRKRKVANEALTGLAPPGVLEGGLPMMPGGAAAAEAPVAPAAPAVAEEATPVETAESTNDADAAAPLPPPAADATATPPPPPPSAGSEDVALFPFGESPAAPRPQEAASAASTAAPASPAAPTGISPTWAFEEDEMDEKSAASLAAEREAAESDAAAADEYRPPRDLATSLREAANVAASVGVIRELSEDNRIQKGKIEKDIPWYLDDFGSDFVFEDVVEALAVYKDANGGGWDIEDDFVVPDPAEMDLFGMVDERAAQGLRIPEGATEREEGVGATAAAAPAPEAVSGGELVGGAESEIEMQQRERRTASVELAEELDSSAAETAAPAQPPTAASSWPEHLAGMPLGSIVRRIRDGSLEVKHLRDRRRALDALGFDWGDPKKFIDVPFEKTMCALLAYHQVRGDTMVYEDYVVPDEVPWPTVLAGFELGKAVLRVRQLQNFFEAYHPDKVSLLSMVDFYWFPEFALPLDPFSWGETAEDDFLSAVGVPFYWLGEQENYPAGIAERLLADGPSDYPDDTARWYNYEYVRNFWEGETGSEVIRMFDDVFGFHLPAYVLRRFGLPKLAKYQEAKFASGRLGEMASERLDVERMQDDLLRPILMSMADLSRLKEEYEEINERIASGDGDSDGAESERLEKEKTSIEWKVEDIVSRLQGLSKEFPGGLREETGRVVERTAEFGSRLRAYEAEVEERVENIDKELQERFPEYDKDEWERRQKTAEKLGAADFARMVGGDDDDASLLGVEGEVEEEAVMDDDEDEEGTAVRAEAADEIEDDDGFDDDAEEEEEEEEEDEDEEEEYLDEEDYDDDIEEEEEES